MKEKEYFKGALINKKVPILVLDQKWHRLFADSGKIRRDSEYGRRIESSHSQDRGRQIRISKT